MESFLPSERKSVQVEEIDLSYDYGYDLDCRILGNCTVKKIMFSTRVSCKHVFALKDIDPSSFPALEGKAFEWHFTKQLPLKRLFADPRKIKRRLKTLQREMEKGCLRIGIDEQSAEFHQK